MRFTLVEVFSGDQIIHDQAPGVDIGRWGYLSKSGNLLRTEIFSPVDSGFVSVENIPFNSGDFHPKFRTSSQEQAFRGKPAIVIKFLAKNVFHSLGDLFAEFNCDR